MQQLPKFALFDFDGTIATRGKIPPEILAGFEHLHKMGCVTSITTGRGYVRLLDVLGDSFHKLVSPETHIIVEHGTKIVRPDGELVFGDFFSEAEVDHIVDFIRSNIGLFRLAWYNPVDATKKVQVWCADTGDVQPETEYRGHYADVFHAPLGELKELLMAEQLTSVGMRLKDHVKVENLKLSFTRTDTNVIFQDGNMEFVKGNTNKGLAVLYVTRELGLKTGQVLLAGNAINDVEMLDLGVGTSILVSPPDKRSTILSYLSAPENIVTVDTPEDLGRYLSGLSE